MLHVLEIYGFEPSAVGTLVHVGGMLLGGRNLFVADSIEDFDRGIAIPLLDGDLVERLFIAGVFGIGGGRFGYRYNCEIEGILAPGSNGHKFSLTNIGLFTVNYCGKDVPVHPVGE